MDKLTEQQKKRMAEAGRAAMNMSHGIKNILQAIGSGKNVMDEALDRHDIDVAKRTWNILKQNLERIQKLSLDMLKFSKDEALNLKPCQFNRLRKESTTILTQIYYNSINLLFFKLFENFLYIPGSAFIIRITISLGFIIQIKSRNCNSA